MNITASHISYANTGYFSRMVADYIAADKKLQPFYHHPVSIEGVKAAIAERKKYPTDRNLLADVLSEQYKSITLTDKQQFNLTQLNSAGTFTITTAHQPNIFTGPLYFIYKILHAIKLAEQLKNELPEYNFVPVYYMGSEDADLAELNHIYINGEKHEWKTDQTGAVGRMKVDKALSKMIDEISGELSVYPFGNEIVAMLKDGYPEGITIEQATFGFVNKLFAEYGLLILLPDNRKLKNAFAPIIKKELSEQFSAKAVAETVAAFPGEYKVQASGRDINLFYLLDNKRERIEFENSTFNIENLKLAFTQEEIFNELNQFPERFSPNVILRPVFQELILPNIAFIGGGGEIAYWLELKKVFDAVGVPYPLLIVRNSFLFIPKELNALKEKLQFDTIDLFRAEIDLFNELVKRDSSVQLSLAKEKIALNDLYAAMKSAAGIIDGTLAEHTEALKIAAVKRIDALEKKMLRAEKKKFDAQQRQLHKIKSYLFPNNSLQERVESITLFYAKYGKDFIKMIEENSKGLEQEFCVIKED
ncbi:bacillithiol biosynthesis cysteine-adding enzyme BshC [Ferruginibacter lapsinanis]|uniref:bacillithiol biosynthesis cysteine-adding enzyme BshC n=1 Tax=Ferruginibacter lapsinanis TaxID=563172 RepID=UPI001E4B62D6|nr:bacillithiol biosynthesis cysteine-adding enzyme BshC [Ferruginibacter lapsinanis]UEG49864.1 bacillithiol biosynthesis cysteine-adding enzyme BshC [Ferruginibacter lapsinanis]